MKKCLCNLCGEKGFELLFKNNDKANSGSEYFDIIRCETCGLVFINPRPKKLSKYYPKNYGPHTLKKNDFYQQLSSSLQRSYYKEHRNFFDFLKSFFYGTIYGSFPREHRGKILDFGCGCGAFLNNFKQVGWDTYGFDFSKNAVEFARREFGINNINLGTLEEQNYSDCFFDVVTMNHVIEHLTDPKANLTEVKRILKKGGFLVINTPDFGSFHARLFGKNWFPLETPRHLFFFETLTLKKMIESIERLQIVKIKHDYSAYCLAKSLGYFLGNRPSINRLLMTVKIVFLPYTILLSLFGRSDIMTFYIKKE